MMRNTATYSVLAAACLLAFLSCERDLPLPASGTPIELTVGIVGDSSPLTKGVTTDSPYGTAATAFGAATNLYMVLKGEKTSATPLYSRTMGSVTASEAAVSFGSAYTRFWEDCYSRDSKLSVFAACVPGKNIELSIGNSSTYNSNTWSSTEVATTIAWPLSGTSADQTAEGFLANQDLCFSNNVSNLGADNRIAFNQSTKKFGNGNLIFHHALTWITFKIKRGNGFANAPFAFSNAATQNIVLSGFNSSGQLTISEGSFPSISTAEISKLAIADHRSEASPAFDYILDGYLVPGTQLTGTDINAVSFVIDNNSYHISKDQLRAALAAKKLSDNTTSALTTENKMRPGVHYVFEFTVSKKGIDKISATVVDWETVTADVFTPSNARIAISLLDNNNPITTGGANGVADFDLFRSAATSGTIDDSFTNYSWGTGYVSHKARLVENATVGEFTAQEPDSPYTEWYWPDNKTFYHFRTVYPKTDTDWKVESEETAGAGDYITLARGASFKDVRWGAPFNALAANAKLTYSLTSGFDNTTETHQISKAIGPTNGAISMTLFHMMSDVTIQLTTTTGDDKVTLAGATIQLSNTYPSGKVRMGNGLVEPDGTPGAAQATVVETSGNYKVENFGFIPQTLENVGGVNEKDVVLTITTADQNEYRVNMKGMKATTIGNNLISNPYTISDGKFTINRWYPNYRYTYTFHLTKTGIAKITATLANWETVSADNENIQIQ